MSEEKDKVKVGIWTPWARVTCCECHGNENLPYPKTEEEWEKLIQPQELENGNAVTFCDDCGTSIQLDNSVATEHNLVAALRERGFEACMAQTGGMCSACSIEPSEELKGEKGPNDVCEILVTFSFDGDNLYWMGVYDNDLSSVDLDWANCSFETQDEVIDHVLKHQDKFAKLEVPEKERPLGDLIHDAKEKASSKNNHEYAPKEPKVPER